jgi:hypothetical protein
MLVTGTGTLLFSRPTAGQGAFTEVVVALGVHLSLPRNWSVMSEEDKIDVQAYAEAAGRRAGIVPATGGMLFSAFRDRADGVRIAWMTVRMNPALPEEPALGRWPDAQKEKLPRSMEEAMTRSISATGLIIVKTPSSSPRWAASPPCVMTHVVVRDPNQPGDFAVQSAFFGRVPNGQHRLVVTANYLVEFTTPFGAICDQIIAGVRFG